MSKLNLKLSYKNACILKHALKDKLVNKKFSYNFIKQHEKDGYFGNEAEFIKDYEDEERALKAISSEIDKNSIIHDSNILKK